MSASSSDAARLHDRVVPIVVVYFVCLTVAFQMGFMDTQHVMDHVFANPVVRILTLAAAGYSATQSVSACSIGLILFLLTFSKQRPLPFSAQDTSSTQPNTDVSKGQQRGGESKKRRLYDFVERVSAEWSEFTRANAGGPH